MWLERLRRRVVVGTVSLFAHAEDPLAHTLDHRGDPGLFGPDTVTWRVMGDPATFVGGIRALMIQAAHPEVVAGVADHSSYRTDPLGRLSRTSNYVTATSYGATPEVEWAVAEVRRAHAPVRGTSHRGIAYSAARPDLAAWVHNSLTDSFLVANQIFGEERLDETAADTFVAEQTRVGRLLGAHPLPLTARELSGYVAHHPDLGPSPGSVEAIAFLTRPPLPRTIRPAYRLLWRAAAATVPEGIRRILAIHPTPLDIPLGKIAVRGLRWALGASPRWRVALLRVGAEIPEHRFKQKFPFEDLRTHPVSPG